MVIICAVLGAAAPSLRGFFVSRQTDDTAARIVSLTKLARSQSVAQGRPYRLHFDIDERTYFLTSQGTAGFRPIDSRLGRPFRLPEEVALEVSGAYGNRDYVSFVPDGRTEPATIRLTDIKGGVSEVVCTAPTEPFVVVKPAEAP